MSPSHMRRGVITSLFLIFTIVKIRGLNKQALNIQHLYRASELGIKKAVIQIRRLFGCGFFCFTFNNTWKVLSMNETE